MRDGKPTYTYNFPGMQRFAIAAKQSPPVANETIRYEFAYDSGGIGKGGAGTLFVNGEKVAQGRIEDTQGIIFSVEEGTDVGQDGETPVVENYGSSAPYRFTGKIDKVTIDLKEMRQAERTEEKRRRGGSCSQEGDGGLGDSPGSGFETKHELG